MKNKILKEWPLLATGLCFAVSVFGGSYWFISRYVFAKQLVKVFVEMKVIDEKGHPIAGAGVFQGKQRIGITDAFGEWSQFLNAYAGSTVLLIFRKQVGKERMGAQKEVPISSSLLLEQEPRIKANVHLSNKWRDTF